LDLGVGEWRGPARRDPIRFAASVQYVDVIRQLALRVMAERLTVGTGTPVESAGSDTSGRSGSAGVDNAGIGAHGAQAILVDVVLQPVLHNCLLLVFWWHG